MAGSIRDNRFVLPAFRVAILIAAFAAILLLAWDAISHRAVPAAGSLAAAADPRPVTGPRVRYPAGRYPLLTLPEGGHRRVRSLLNVTKPMRFGDYVWNDDRIPAGATWVRVDLARQTLSVFRAGHEIGSAVILYGTDGKPTPSGLFPIMQKAEHHRSSLYDAEMPFMLRLTGDGVAIHASEVRQGSATHGCIGIPIAFARLLFAQVKRGDLVAILPLPAVRADRPLA